MPACSVDDDARADLEKLAGVLGPRGCKTVLVTREGRLPALEVVNGEFPGLSGRVYATADHFWWSYAELIAPRDQVTTAARAIAVTLAVRGVS
jgi:hypothetical protein